MHMSVPMPSAWAICGGQEWAGQGSSEDGSIPSVWWYGRPAVGWGTQGWHAVGRDPWGDAVFPEQRGIGYTGKGVSSLPWGSTAPPGAIHCSTYLLFCPPYHKANSVR